MIGFDMAIWGEHFKHAEYHRRHLVRYRAYIKEHGLICQECGGSGGYKEVVCDDGTGPWYDCGFCEGTGYVTRWMRGQWLRWKALERKLKKERNAE